MSKQANQDGLIRVERVGIFKLSTETIIKTTARFSAIAQTDLHIPKENERGYSNRVPKVCSRLLKEAGRRSSVFTSVERPDAGSDIIRMHLTVTENSSGRPYQISLSAIQTNARWFGVIERPYYRYVPGNIPISRDNKTPDGRPYWDPGRDIDALAKQFCTHLLNGG